MFLAMAHCSAANTADGGKSTACRAGYLPLLVSGFSRETAKRQGSGHSESPFQVFVEAAPAGAKASKVAHFGCRLRVSSAIDP